MALLDVPELREHVTTALDDAALQLLLDASETVITAVAGPLVDPDDELTEVHDGGFTWITLHRRAAAISEITEQARPSSAITTLAADDWRLSWDTVSVRRLHFGTHPSTWWVGDVSVKYSLVDDLAERKVAQIALIGLLLTRNPGLSSQRIGEWSEAYLSSAEFAAEREDILAALLPITPDFA